MSYQEDLATFQIDGLRLMLLTVSCVYYDREKAKHRKRQLDKNVVVEIGSWVMLPNKFEQIGMHFVQRSV